MNKQWQLLMKGYFLLQLTRAHSFIIILIVCIQAYGMALYCDQLPVAIPNTTCIVGSFLLTYKPDLFNHDMICSLARTNKEWENIVKNVATKLRAHFIRKIPQNFFNSGESVIIWHKNGTAFGRKCLISAKNEKDGLSDKKENVVVSLDSMYWNQGEIEVYSTAPFYGSKKKMKDIVRPVFSENSDFCFYSVGGNISLWGQNKHVVEYRLLRKSSLYSLHSCTHIFRCGLKLTKITNYALSYFLSFPFLLKCFLNSKVVVEIEDFSKLYSLKHAIIPHNYQECVPIKKDGYQSFDELPEQLKEKIIEHYNKQQARKYGDHFNEK